MKDNKQFLCSYTKGQVGWRDSFPFNGLYDPVDTAPSVSWANLSYGPTYPYWGNSQIQGQGQVVDNPYPSPTRTPVTINKVQAHYFVDGGALVGATPTDGAFDSDVEAFNFTSSSQADGTHWVGIQATNSVGNFVQLFPPLQVYIDTTPPPSPPAGAVIAQAPYSSDPTKVTVNWAGPAPPDPESGIANHYVALYRSGLIAPLAQAYVQMPLLTHTFSGLNMQHGLSTWAVVQGTNGAGLRGPGSSSSNLTIDLTPPGLPAPILDSGAGTSSLSSLAFSWTAATEDISGISNYYLHIYDETGMTVGTSWTGNVISYTATGLPLVLGTKYYGRVQAMNGASALGPFAPPSDGIMVANLYQSIGAAKLNATLGEPVYFNSLLVTASGSDQPGAIYVQETGGSAGIRTDSNDIHAKGAKVQAAGRLQLNGNQELYLSNSEVASVGGSQTLRPVGLSGSALGGGTFGLQPGVTGGSGINTIGLLVKIWGNVTYATASPPHYFVVDDGSGLLDPAGRQGVGCYCGNITPPSAGTFVSVTGISSISSGCPTVLLRQTGDWR